VVFRVIGAELFGVYSVAVAVVGLAGGLHAGIISAIVKRVSEARGTAREELPVVASLTLRAGLALTGLAVLALAILATAVAGAGKHFGFVGTPDSEVSLVFVLVAAGGGAGFLLMPFVGICEGLERYEASAALISLRALMNSATDVLVILATGSLPLMLAVRLANNVLVVAVAGRLVARLSGHGIGPRYRPTGSVVEAARNLVKFGYNLSLAYLGGAVMVRGPYFILSASVGPAATGVFALANELASKVLRLTSGASEFLFPAASRSVAEGDVRDLRRVLNRAYLVACTVGLPIVVGIALSSHTVVEPLLGLASDPNRNLLRVSLFVLPIIYYLHGVSSFEYAIVNGFGQPRINRNYNLLLAAGTVAVGAVGTMWLGAEGILLGMSLIGTGSILYIDYVRRRVLARPAVFFAPALDMSLVVSVLTIPCAILGWVREWQPMVWLASGFAIPAVCLLYASRRGYHQRIQDLAPRSSATMAE
jgi:O-antigen/teichoic acid export membrane protein